MKDKSKIEKLKEIKEDKYKNVDLDHLMMYVMGQLEQIGADLSYENAVVAAFKIFPRKFSLPGYPEHPDSNRVEQCLWRCAGKTRQWLSGKARQGFIITNRSRLFIKEAEDLLSGILYKKTKATSQTRRKESILAEVIASSAYKKYLKGEGDFITEAEFCFLLQGTLDSSKETLKKNFNSLKIFADELVRKDVVEFLDWLEERFKKFLNIN
jgi:hypothetical protein